MHRFKWAPWRSASISKKLLALILLFSSMVTLLLTIMQLYIEYRRGAEEISEELSFIQKRQLPSLAFAVWTLNRHQVDSIAKSIIFSPNISYIKIFDPETRFINESGKLEGYYKRVVRYDLVHKGPAGEVHKVGSMRLHVSYKNLYDQLLNRILFILCTQAVKTFIVSFFILWIVGQVVIRDLNKMAGFLGDLRFPKDTGKTFLPDSDRGQDELDILISKFNEMTVRLDNSYQQINLWNDGLEEMVAQRMVEIKKLQDKNAHLIRVLCHDMANSSMAISLVEYKLRRICGTMMEGNSQQDDVKKLMKTLQANSKRQQEILTQVRDAVMATEEETIIVNLDTVPVQKLFDEIEYTFQEQLRDKGIKLNKSITPAGANLQIDYGIFKNNVLSNLVSNAIKFSFSGGDIDLVFSQDGLQKYLSVINYGEPISQEDITAIMSLHKIKSSPGTKGEMGSGIGMMILQKCLKAHDGRLEIISSSSSVEFKIHLLENQDLLASDID